MRFAIFARTARADSFRRTLQTVSRDLQDLNRHTERDFLQVGAKLGVLLETVREVSGQAASAAELISGERTAGASSALQEVLSYAAGQSAGRDIAGLRAVLSDADAVRIPLERVQSMVRSFRVMGTLTQIESARLTAARIGFADLAGDVATLANEIESQAGHILETAGQMRTQVAGTLARVMSAENQQMARLPEITARVQSGMRALEDARRQASEASARLAGRYQDTSAQVGELVASLQFQDITRQQLEHVCEALAAAGRDLEANPRSMGGLRAVVELQQAQLTATAAAFSSSVGQIRETLHAIATDVSAMAQASEELLGSAREGTSSSFAALERDLTELLETLSRWSETERDRIAGLHSLRETVAQMNGLAEGIQGITIRMQRIALNSSIRAIQIGEPGAALASVADAIQRLSADSSGIAEEVAGILGGLLAKVRGVGEHAAVDRGQAGGAAHLRHSLETLRAAEETTCARIASVSNLAARLSAELTESLRRFGDQARFGEVVEACRKKLAEVASRTGAARQAGVGEQHVSQLRSRYTMQTERSVHDNLVGSAAAEPAAAGGGEFGANVDLF